MLYEQLKDVRATTIPEKHLRVLGRGSEEIKDCVNTTVQDSKNMTENS